MSLHPHTHAQTAPDRPAIVMAGGGETVSYGELEAQANRIAHWLRAQGVGKGDDFALLMENNAHYLQIAWGSQRIGATIVPISTHLTAEEIAYIVRDSGAKLLITSPRFDGVAGAFRKDCPDVPVWRLGGGEDDFLASVAQQPDTLPEDTAPGLDMLYSSGTTGRPKGIRNTTPQEDDFQSVHPFIMLVHGLFQVPMDGSAVYLCPGPLYHAAPFRWSMAIHRLGGTVVVMEKFDPEGALAAIERHKVTVSQWVPTHFVRMLKLPEEVRTCYDLSSHTTAIHAAAPCPVPVKQAMMEWWGPIIYEYYGGSEGNGLTMANPQDWLDHPGTVGKPILGVPHICDADGSEVPQGETGIVYFESENSFEYHNDPDKTREAVLPNGWSTLGDIGRLDEDGFLYLTDRKSHMIISGGVNIYPQEVENLLITHDAVMDAAVVGAPCPDMGEKVVAVVQPHDGSADPDTLEADLRAFLEERLAKLKTPREYVFRDELPREANGKLYKRKLRDEFAAKAPA